MRSPKLPEALNKSQKSSLQRESVLGSKIDFIYFLHTSHTQQTFSLSLKIYTRTQRVTQEEDAFLLRVCVCFSLANRSQVKKSCFYLKRNWVGETSVTLLIHNNERSKRRVFDERGAEERRYDDERKRFFLQKHVPMGRRHRPVASNRRTRRERVSVFIKFDSTGRRTRTSFEVLPFRG